MSTLDRLTHLIHDKFGVELADIDPDAPFATYNLDSLTVAELMFEIDDAFQRASASPASASRARWATRPRPTGSAWSPAKVRSGAWPSTACPTSPPRR